jgi:hypothetical protein
METMTIEILLPDVRPGRTFELASYTVFAGGRLELACSDGSVKVSELGEWMDVRFPGDYREGPEVGSYASLGRVPRLSKISGGQGSRSLAGLWPSLCHLPATWDHVAAGFASGMGPPPLPVMGPP